MTKKQLNSFLGKENLRYDAADQTRSRFVDVCGALCGAIAGTSRESGIVAGLGMLWFCVALWGFGAEVTEGMHTEINFCKNLNIRIKKINEKDIIKVIGG